MTCRKVLQFANVGLKTQTQIYDIEGVSHSYSHPAMQVHLPVLA